jgi:hypothetical protein
MRPKVDQIQATTGSIENASINHFFTQNAVFLEDRKQDIHVAYLCGSVINDKFVVSQSYQSILDQVKGAKIIVLFAIYEETKTYEIWGWCEDEFNGTLAQEFGIRHLTSSPFTDTNVIPGECINPRLELLIERITDWKGFS